MASAIRLEPRDLVVVVEEELPGVGDAVVGVDRALPHGHDTRSSPGLGLVVVHQLRRHRAIHVGEAHKGGRRLDAVLGRHRTYLQWPEQSIPTGHR